MINEHILLSVGLEGSFELSAPFTNFIRPQARYTVRSLRTMGDIIAAGENPQDLYTSAGVPEADYIRDLQRDVCVVGLQSSAGEWIYVPQSFIATLPSMEGVSYRPLALVAALGLVADHKDLVNLLTAVNALVLAHVGVDSQCTVAAVGAAELVPQSEHATIESVRGARVSVSESEAGKVVRLGLENASLRHQLQVLSNHIKTLG